MSITAIRSRPVNPPSPTRHCHPEQSLWRCSTDMVVQRSGSLVKTSCMPRVTKSKPPKIEMVAELVAEGAEESSERRNVFPHRRASPYPYQHAFGSVVSKKLCNRVFPNSQRSGRKCADTALWDAVEFRCGRQKVSASASDSRSRPVCHRLFDGFCEGEQTSVLRKVECSDAVTFQKPITIRIAWGNVCQHCTQCSEGA